MVDLVSLSLRGRGVGGIVGIGSSLSRSYKLLFRIFLHFLVGFPGLCFNFWGRIFVFRGLRNGNGGFAATGFVG